MNNNVDANKPTSDMLARARKAFSTNVTKNLAFRKKQLRGLDSLLSENEDLLANALKKDLRKPFFESILAEIEFVRNEVRCMLMNVDKWSKPQKVERNLLSLFDDAYLQPEPYGVVLVIGAWNYPLQLSLSPLIGAIATGNCAIVKPSELAPATARVIAELVPRYLDKECYHITLGGPEETTKLIQEKFDYIFYTGGTRVGKIIYQAAAKHMTPVTLELGGKCPVIFDDSIANILPAVRRLVWGKFLNTGQTCVAPDYILCSREVQKKLLDHIPKVIKEFYGDDPLKSEDYGRIVNENHFNRLVKQIEANKSKIVIGGNSNAQELFIAPTVMANVTPQDSIMQDEIFGPILPIVLVEDIDEAIKFIQSREKPLSLYVYSKKQSVVDKIRKETSSGSMCINDNLLQLSVDTLPFGGVGNSGIGAYHGKFSFDTFSHQKAVLHRGWSSLLEALGSHRYPPYSKQSLFIMKLLTQKRWFLPDNYPLIIAFFSGMFILFLVQTLAKNI